jgi:hypothetical protein
MVPHEGAKVNIARRLAGTVRMVPLRNRPQGTVRAGEKGADRKTPAFQDICLRGFRVLSGRFMMRGQAERRWMMRTDKLVATWDGFLRMSPGERRVFLQWMRDWHLQRRIAAVAARGTTIPIAGLIPTARDCDSLGIPKSVKL